MNLLRSIQYNGYVKFFLYMGNLVKKKMRESLVTWPLPDCKFQEAVFLSGYRCTDYGNHRERIKETLHAEYRQSGRIKEKEEKKDH